MGSRLPAERKLAEEFLVSRAVVRTTIRQLVDAGLLDQKPNHRPVVRRRLAPVGGAKKLGRIAVWMPSDDQDVGAPLILKGIRKIAGDAGRQLIVTGPQYDKESTEQEVIDFLRSVQSDADIDGVILWAPDEPALVPHYREVVAHGLPLVFIDRDPPEPVGADVVAADHYRGARAAVQHLLALGHRRIAMVTNDDRVSSVRERTDGYLSALREAGVRTDERLIAEVSFIHAYDIAESTQRAVERWLALESPPTAVFAVNDQIAMYVQEALSERGLRVPQDFSLVGFDWFLRWLPSGGELTTIAQPFEKIGEIAATRLFEKISLGSAHVPCHTLLPAPLVAKASTRSLVHYTALAVAPLKE